MEEKKHNNMELKDVIDFLGYKPEEVKDLTELKTKFDSEFIRLTNINEETEPVKKIIGRVYGTLENEVKKVSKNLDLNIDFEAEDYKAIKKATDKFGFAFNKLNEKNKTLIDELTIKANSGNDEKVKDWEKKYDKAAQKIKDTEGLLSATTNEYNTFKETSLNQLKGVKLDVLKKDAYGKLKFKSDISDFEKRGYYATIADKYDLDLDENESLIVKDKKGSLIPSTKVTGAFKSLTEILEEEAIAGKLYQMNPDGGKPKPMVTFGQKQQQPQPQPGIKQRVVAKRL